MSIFNSSLYKESPIFLQNLLVSMNGYLYTLMRQGSSFKKILSELEESQWYSKIELEELQNEKLRRLVKHVYENIPYYKKVMKERKLKPEDIKTRNDLYKLPILTKRIVRENFDDLVARNVNRRFLYMGHTSGTTGTPVRFYRDLYLINFENAIIWRQWRSSRFNFRDKRITLRGDLVVPVEQKEPPFWRYNAAERQLYMSSYHLSKENLKYYVERILAFQPDAIQAYPSSVYLLALCLKKERIDNINLRGIFTSSETLLVKQREVIEKQFNCRIFDSYGNAERVAAIQECEKGNYHIIPEYGITEYRSLDKKRFEGETKLIATGLNNYSMPLIRYDTGDIVVPSGEKCLCKRNFVVVKEIEGRKDDFLLLHDGRYIGRMDHIYKGLNNIVESQIIQEKMDELIIKVVPDENYSKKDERLLLQKIRERIGGTIRIKIEKVDDIPRAKEGKFRAVISKIKITL